MATSNVPITQGNGTSVIATNSITEDSTTKQLQRVVVNTSAGAEVATFPVSIATNTPVGNVAHDAADSGAPIKTGAKAVATLSTTSLVSAADRVDNVADLDAGLIVKPYATGGDYIDGVATNTDGTSTAVIAAAGAGIKIAITSVIICNTSTSSITVDLKSGSTTRATFPVPANGGVAMSLGTPLVGSGNAAWNFGPSAATSTVKCTLIGFKTKI